MKLIGGNPCEKMKEATRGKHGTPHETEVKTLRGNLPGKFVMLSFSISASIPCPD